MLIGQLAKRTNVTKDAIRLYEKRGYITSQPLGAGTKTYRDYSEDVVDTVMSIRQARTMNVPLKDWKTFYDEWSKEELTDRRRHALLANEVLKIRSHIKQLKNFEALMLRKMKQYDNQETLRHKPLL